MRIPIYHYIEMTASIKPDDYPEFYLTNEGGKQYLVEIWK